MLNNYEQGFEEAFYKMAGMSTKEAGWGKAIGSFVNAATGRGKTVSLAKTMVNAPGVKAPGVLSNAGAKLKNFGNIMSGKGRTVSVAEGAAAKAPVAKGVSKVTNATPTITGTKPVTAINKPTNQSVEAFTKNPPGKFWTGKRKLIAGGVIGTAGAVAAGNHMLRTPPPQSRSTQYGTSQYRPSYAPRY